MYFDDEIGDDFGVNVNFRCFKNDSFEGSLVIK